MASRVWWPEATQESTAMTKLELVQAAWKRQIDAWQYELARGDPIPICQQSRDGTRDCWRGFVLPLMNMALEIAGEEFRIPDRVSSEQERTGERYIGQDGIELFRDLSERVPERNMRIGDVIVFILKSRTHVALVVGNKRIAHAADTGVCRARSDAVIKLRAKVLRYNGPGSSIFD